MEPIFLEMGMHRFASGRKQTYQAVSGRSILKDVAPKPQVQAKSWSKKFKVVCKDCNNGWMSRLEEDVNPFLIPLMRRQPVDLDPRQQGLLAAWIVMKAIIYEQGSEGVPMFTTRDRQSIKQLRVAPANVHIDLFSCIDVRWSAEIRKVAGQIVQSPDEVDFTKRNVQQITWGIGTLLISLFHLQHDIGFTSPPSANKRRLWPVTGQKLSWPPSHALDFIQASNVAVLLSRYLDSIAIV